MFSNGIVLLTVLSVGLMLVAGATVDALIPFYAIGVFTGFAMAGFGMARYHRRNREPGWRRKLVINTAGGIYTGLVVVLFAVVKFTEGAWLIVILFPGLVYLLIRLNREYRHEAEILDDLTAARPAAAVRRTSPGASSWSWSTATTWPPSPRSGTPRACARPRCGRCTSAWTAPGPTAAAAVAGGGHRGPLELADCPDRRLAHAAARLAAAEAAIPGTHVTVVLPRRSYPVLAGRLLHDHTADRIARVVSRVPSAAATIIPFDVQHKVETLKARRARAGPTSQRIRVAGAAVGHGPDRLPAATWPGHRAGAPARGRGPARPGQQRAGL